MNSHEKYIRRCIELAIKGGKNTRINPNVGAVLVFEERIIGEGYHKERGGPHAEINALNSVSKEDHYLVKDATLYVSLEPCNIHSLTPPCSEAILDAGIKKVVISTLDPNPKVAGHSIESLKNKGVQVITEVCEEMGRDLIRPFVAHLSKRPYVILKWAQSSDAYMGKRGEQIQISSDKTGIMTHTWRTEIDAILVGHDTVLTDDPQLNTRYVNGDSPKRIVFSSNPEELIEAKILTDGNPTLVVGPHDMQENERGVGFLNHGIQAIDLPDLLRELYTMDILYLMIEGGAKTLKKFIEAGLWDEARVITSSQSLVSGIRAPYLTGRRFRQLEMGLDTIDYVYPHDKC